mmetsp:Transcript_7073/g.17536  ORF Transcript_7073/g.17536 Transcript_7073/m.17536 type:complete len:423 (+) Transcript_7073:105-1373(+)
METDGASAANAGGNPSRSRSLPTLPPVSGASNSHPREEFLAGLLNEDLQNLTKWHGTRPHHEQKRFLRSVNTLYKAFEAADNGTWAAQTRANQAKRQQAENRAAAVAAAANAAAAARASVEDPLNGPPRDTPRALAPSASEPSLQPARPIEVFEQKKRQNMRGQRRPGDEEANTLAMWMEGMSVSSQTTATTASTQLTRFSDLTKTSDGGSSLCSEPGTTNQLAYRIHKRARAANRRKGQAGDQHSAGNMPDGIPNIGFPDCERFTTQFKDAFGEAKQSAQVHPNMYQSVLQSNSHPFVTRFLETAAPEHKEQFAGMVRSLEYLRNAKVRERQSMQRQELNLEENRRLFKPSRQRPVFDTSECNLSKVPLGTIPQEKAKKAAWADVTPPEHPANARPQPPPSPSVSGLGSLPLSRLSTPAVL